MCLVSFIPTKEGFVFSSNRDEFVQRDALEIRKEKINGEFVWFPYDQKGGSWIFCSESGKMACILNGAFESHERKLPYRQSRGLMGKEAFGYIDFVEFIEQYSFSGIEPFTMILKDLTTLLELRWDGNRKFLEILNQDEMHIWSSCTLYDNEAIHNREHLLRRELSNIKPTNYPKVLEAHVVRDENNLENGLYMNRFNVLQTISHSQIVVKHNQVHLTYVNLLHSSVSKVSIK